MYLHVLLFVPHKNLDWTFNLLFSHRALLRPGRFDVEVKVFPPDLKGRREILQLYLSKIKMGSGMLHKLSWFKTFISYQKTNMQSLDIHILLFYYNKQT